MKHQESILVIPKRAIPEGHYDSNFVEDIKPISLLRHAIYMPRYLAETNEEYVQIIPYVVVASKGRILSYQRSSGGGEDRLYGKYSIGIGGHLDFVEGESPITCMQNGMAREMKEELGLDSEMSDYAPLGTLYDPSDAVGRVHFGLVYGLEVPDLDITSGELDILINRQLLTLGEMGDYNQYEEWSKAVLVYLSAGIITEVSAEDMRAELDALREDLK